MAFGRHHGSTKIITAGVHSVSNLLSGLTRYSVRLSLAYLSVSRLSRRLFGSEQQNSAADTRKFELVLYDAIPPTPLVVLESKATSCRLSRLFTKATQA